MWQQPAQINDYSKRNLKQYQGKVLRISDGDTLQIRDDHGQKQRVRLAFIDAPETEQAVGATVSANCNACWTTNRYWYKWWTLTITSAKWPLCGCKTKTSMPPKLPAAWLGNTHPSPNVSKPAKAISITIVWSKVRAVVKRGCGAIDKHKRRGNTVSNAGSSNEPIQTSRNFQPFTGR
jgi:hypothetical protein